MAKLILTIEPRFQNVEKSIETLKTKIEGLIPSFSMKGAKVDSELIKGLEQLKTTLKTIKVDPTVTNGIKALTEHYKQLGIVVRDIAKEYSNLDAQQRKQEQIIRSQASNVETVRKGYANLISTLKTLKGQYSGEAFGSLPDEAQKSFEEVEQLSQAFEKNKSLSEEETKSLSRLSQQLKKLQADLAALKAKNEKIVSPNPFSVSQAQQIPKLTKQYSALLTSIKNTEKYYPKGTFDIFKKELSSGLTTLSSLNTEFQQTGTLSEKSQKVLNDTANAFNNISAEVSKTQSALKSSKGSLADIVSGFLKFQLSAMLVMKPLQMLRSALSSINETLVKTEDSVVALQRVLNDSSLNNDEISTRLYKIAQDYGQTFDNVSQIAQNFARTGMSWADTIKATEAAVLALNVAELDATEASDGMVAILTQFGLKAEDLTLVVDKLNITADNAAVTTEKLLAALQRTGSAASNANLSLDETLSIITALSEATGRSGQNLGTALNSLIQYSSKASALDTFANLSDDTAAAVAKFRQGGANILEVWQVVSKEIKNLKSEQADLLDGYFATEDGNALKEALDGELEDIYTELGGVYDTANTFRKNYFIALLGNMDTVLKAQETLASAEGYSQTENEKYLDTYTAKLNSLQAQWQTLIADENGILSIKKAFVELGSGLLTVLNAVGGLRTALIAIGSTLGSVLGGKILGSAITNVSKLVTSFKTGEKSVKGLWLSFTNAISPIKKFQSATKALKAAQDAQKNATEAQNIADSIRKGQLVEGITLEQADKAAKDAQTIATQKATAATQAWGAAIQTALGWIGLIVTAISAFVGIAQQAEADKQAALEKARQEREAIIDEWDALKEEAVAFAELNTQYKELRDLSNKTAEQEKDFLSVQESIVKALGYKAVALKKLEEGTGEYQAKLEELTQAEMKRYALQAQGAANAAQENFSEARINFSIAGVERLGTYFDQYEKSITGDLTEKNINKDVQILHEGWGEQQSAYAVLEIYRKYLEAMYDNGFGETQEYSEAFAFYDESRKQTEEYLATLSQNEAWKYLSQNGLPQTQEEIENIVNSVINVTGATENWRDTIEGVVVELTGFKPPKKEIDDWSNNITKVKDQYDDLISKLEELRDLQKESTEWEEKKLAVLEAEQALENAKNEATVRRFNEATGQWEWQTDEKKIAEAEKNLEQAQLNLQEAAYDNIIDQLKEENATNDSILAILKEVAPLLGEDFSNAVQNAIKDKTGVDITKPIVTPSESHDNGGLALGKGFINKATDLPESVNNPELTKKILSPVSNAEFNRYVRDMGIMFERSHQYAQVAPVIERVGGAVDNRVNNSGQVIMNGVAIGSDKRGSSLDEILSLASIVPND